MELRNTGNLVYLLEVPSGRSSVVGFISGENLVDLVLQGVRDEGIGAKIFRELLDILYIHLDVHRLAKQIFNGFDIVEFFIDWFTVIVTNIKFDLQGAALPTFAFTREHLGWSHLGSHGITERPQSDI